MSETVRLKVIGMGGKVFHTATVEKLIPEAVELCARGYTVCLSTTASGTILEIRRLHHDDKHAHAVIRPEGAVPPEWGRVALNLIKSTPLPRRTTR